MKLLGWMNQKLRQNSIEPLKNFSIGNSCSCLSVLPLADEQQYHIEPSFSLAHSRQTKACPEYSTGLTANKEEDVLKEEPSIMMSDAFHGFLTIGTLGSEPIITEPTTPRFPISFQNLKEKETEVTENELQVIKDELEKFLDAEAKEMHYESSERSSVVSTITLDGYQIDSADVEEHKNTVSCPLQGHLFGSSIECPETGEEIKKGSLRELFKNNSIDYEQCKGQSGKEGKQSKGTHVMQFMKKMLKKIHVPSRSCKDSDNGHAADTFKTKRKLRKAPRIFHRRIHPEGSTVDKKFTENKNTSHSGKHQDGDVTFLDNDNKRFIHTTMSKEKITTMSLSNNRLSKTHSSGNGERWIKTDSDYVVLEL